MFGEGDRAVYAAMNERVKYIYSAADARASRLPVGDAIGETVPLASGSALWNDAEALGDGLRRRLAEMGARHVLDGDDWRRFPTHPEQWELDDRSPAQRGLQFAVWPSA